jgi:uncharacterized protein YggU (UPF0235/DUF167 family)
MRSRTRTATTRRIRPKPPKVDRAEPILGPMATPSTRLRLRVSPGARSSAVVGRYGKAWKVRVAAAPEGGKANEALLRLLADRLELPQVNLRLISGQSSRDKLVELTGIDERETERRLDGGAETP